MNKYQLGKMKIVLTEIGNHMVGKEPFVLKGTLYGCTITEGGAFSMDAIKIQPI